ncbi:hypothetical protein OG226_08460 [Streptomyces sp. NBC_01261]|uniref:hypothetical protein n=1 Tax=Streptomyces sp. NBC_01261 TaxID=2903802 RepID=UPI002E2FDBE3|nr:hypothetical protein [Streptomyces sp. NBC_01261]
MPDRHRDTLAPHLDAWLDVQRPDHPAWLDGAGLRATYAALAHRPVRTRPYFNSTPWGGHWAQRELGFNPDSPNTALGYELIAPEAGILIGTGPETKGKASPCTRRPETGTNWPTRRRSPCRPRWAAAPCEQRSAARSVS